jgi:hypothetical protein
MSEIVNVIEAFRRLRDGRAAAVRPVSWRQTSRFVLRRDGQYRLCIRAGGGRFSPNPDQLLEAWECFPPLVLTKP